MNPPTPTERGAGSVSTRPWWIASEGIRFRGRPGCEPTSEERSLAERLERQSTLGHYRIPMIPAVAARAVAMLTSHDADPEKVSRLIHEDQQLAADVIAFSNSSLFAGATKNTNIPQAIGRVGFRRTRSLIFAASLRAVIYSGSDLARAEMLWRQACGCAAIASQVAKTLRENADDYYVAGLFHDVGKTVVLSLLETIAVRSRQVPLRAEFVDLMLELHHGRVGIEVVKRWGLPEQVEEANRAHAAGPDEPLTRVQAIVTLASNACRRLEIGSVDDGREIAGPRVLAALGAAESDLCCILEGVQESAGLA